MPKVLDALKHVKRTLRGTADRDALASLLPSRVKLGRVRWLEIGVGDGANLEFLLSALRDDRDFDIDLVDPQVDQTDLRVSFDHHLFRVPIEEFEPNLHYDVINCRQSAYYFWDREHTPTKLARMLNSTGALAVTVWTEDCLLFRLHTKIASLSGERPTMVTHRELSSQLTQFGFLQVASEITLGQIDLTEGIDPAVAIGIFDLCSRRLNSGVFTEAKKLEITFEFIANEKGHGLRENGVSIYQKI